MTEPLPTTDDPLVGAQIDGRYRIESLLAQGGMGVVYAAVHEELRRQVAIKVLNPAWASDPEGASRFLREARMASSLAHPNIVDVWDLGRLPDGRPYLVMPRIDGNDLANLLAQHGPQHPRRVAALLLGAAAALDVTHSKGFVHRDIKPENLLHVVREDGSETVLVLDFGIAAAVSGSRLTQQGVVCGTPDFLPPEAITGAVPDARGDVYALATVAFELMTGLLPFHGVDPFRLLPVKLATHAPSLSEVTGRPFPESIERVLARGLAKTPDRRYASAGQFVSSLAAVANDVEDYPEAWPEGFVARAGARVSSTVRRTEQEHSRPDASDARAIDRISTAQHALPPVAQPAPSPLPAPRIALALDEDLDVELAPLRRRRDHGATVAVAGVATLSVLLFWAVRGLVPTTPALSPQAPAAQVAPTPQPPPTVQMMLPPPGAPLAPAAVAPAPSAPAQPDPHALRAGKPRSRRIAPASARVQPSAPSLSVVELPDPAPALEAPVPAQPNASALDPLGPEAPPSAAPDPQQTRRERARRYNDHATAAMLQGQLGSALSLFGNALEADPSYPPAYRGQGLVLQQLGRPAEAVEAFRQFLRLQPNGEQSDKIRERLKSIEETHSL